MIAGGIFGKPKDEEEAIIMIEKISGKEFRVITEVFNCKAQDRDIIQEVCRE